jgi:hypothetical protein
MKKPIFLLFGLLIPTLGLAQPYTIDWYQVAGGGGTSTGGTYSVTGTIGQPDAGTALSGDYFTLIGGFWSLVSVVQTTGGPTLFTSYAGDKVTVYWQAQTGWILQANPNLNAPTGWTNSLDLVTVNGVSFHSVANSIGALFFRLKR